MRNWTVINCIDALDDGRHRERGISRIKKLILHRVGKDIPNNLSLGDTGPEIAKQFLFNPEVAKYTGGQNPYTFYIDPGVGKIWQALPIDEVGNHARRWNVPGLGIALIGDYRHEEPSNALWGAAKVLCGHLVEALGLTPWDIQGHTESGPGATSTPGKQCPGAKFDVGFFRVSLAGDMPWVPYEDEKDRLARMEKARAQKHGIVWDGI